MSKKIIFLIIFIITILVILPVFYFLYLHKPTPSETTPKIETTLSLQDEGIIIDATRDTDKKTVELRIRAISESDIDQNSLMFRDLVILSCTIYQKYYYDLEFRKKSEEEVASVGLNKTNIEKQVDEFLEGYSLESVKIEAFNEDETRLYTCSITGPNEEDNLIGLFSEDGSRFSFKLDKADEYYG